MTEARPRRTVVLIHTVPPLVSVFQKLIAELLPGVRQLHVLDEPLLACVKQRGGLAPVDGERLAAHAATAAAAGADLVLVTCSTVSPAVEWVRGGPTPAPLPVLKIDEAMAAQAVTEAVARAAGQDRLGRIGVVATAAVTLEPTRTMLEAEAARQGCRVETELVLVEGALPALLDGDAQTHDRLVSEAALALARQSDVVVLAQASMARALSLIEQDAPAAPVLTSPHAALAQVRRLLEAMEGGQA